MDNKIELTKDQWRLVSEALHGCVHYYKTKSKGCIITSALEPMIDYTSKACEMHKLEEDINKQLDI